MFPPWLLLLLAFIGEGESNLQIRKLNCDVTGEATTDESPLLLEKVCTSPSLTLQSSMEKVGDNPTRKVTLLLSSLSPILGVDQVNGNGSYITVVTSQDVPSDFDIEKTTKLDFDGNLNVNFPKACGTFYLISVLNISDGVKYIVSDDYVRIKRQCEDQGEINVNLTVSGSFGAPLKMDSNGNLDTNGVTVTLLNNGPKGVSARTVIDAMVIRASIPDVTDEYWFRRLFYYYNVFNNNTTLQEVSDRLEWSLKLRDSLAATRLSGLETTLLDESKKVGIGMDPGDEKNIDLSLLKIPKSVIQKCPNAGLTLLWLGLGVNVQDSNKNQQLILPIECNPGSTYSDKQLSAKECTILPSVSSDGKDAIFYRNQDYNSFKYDGSKMGFSAVSTSRLTDDLMKHAFISERATRLSALGLCPQPPIDDDPTQAIRSSLVQDINSLLNAMQQSLQNDESETTNRVSKVVDLLAALTNEYFKGQEKFMQFFTRLVTFSYRMTVSMIKKTGKTFGMKDESGNSGNNTNEDRRQLYKALDRSNAVIRKESEESEKCEFMCDNGKICITTIMICDKRDDCMDGMDEQMCDKMGLSEKSARLLSSKINRDPSRGGDSRLTNVEQPEDIRGDVNMTLQAGARTGGQGSRTGRGRGTLRRPRDFDNFDDDQAFEDEENYRNGGDRREGGRSRDRFGRERNRGPDENSGEEDNFDDDQAFEDEENYRNGGDRREGGRSRDRFGRERNRGPDENSGEEDNFDDDQAFEDEENYRNGGDRREGGRSRDRFGRERNRGPDENSGEEDNFDDDQAFEDEENYRNGGDRREGGRSRDRFGRERNRGPDENSGEEDNFDDDQAFEDEENYRNGGDRREGGRSRDRFGRERNRGPDENSGEEDNFDDDQAFEDEENYRNGGDRREGGRSRDRFGRERNRGPDENSGEEDNFDDDQTFEDSFADTMDGENVRNGRDRRGGRRSRKGGERDRFGKERNRQPFENTGEGTESDFDDLNLLHNLEFFNNNNYNVSIDDEIFWKNTLKNIQNEISNGPRSSNGRKRNSDGTKSKRGKGGGKKPNTRSQKSCSDGRMSPMKSEDQKLKKWLERLYYSVSLANSATDIPEIDFIPSTIMDKIIDVLKQYDNGAFDTLVTPWMMYFDSVSQSNEFNPFMDKFEKLMMQVMQKGANFAALKTTTEDFLNYLIDTVSNDVSNFIGEEDPSLQAGLKSSLVVLNMVKDNFEAVINVVRKLLVFQRSKPYEWKMLNIPAGREPTEMMDCYRAAGMALTMEQEQTKKEEEKSPYYNLFDSLSERIKEKPIRWMQYKSGIYRGERSSLIGSVMWEKVATCSCRKTSYNYNYLQKDNEESVTLENDGKRSHSRSDDGNDIERNANELDSEVFVDIKSLLPKTSESFFDYDYGDFGLTPILPDKDEETGSDKPENSFRAINFPSPNNYYFTRRNAALRRQVEVVPVNSSIVRLAGGSKRRVNDEIIYRGMVTVQRRVPGTRAMDIGFICDHGWDAEDANVTCSILLNRVKRGVLKEFREIKGTELLDEYFQSMQRFLPPMMLKNVSCPIGAEDILLQCSYDGWYEQDCESYQRAGVECTFSIP